VGNSLVLSALELFEEINGVVLEVINGLDLYAFEQNGVHRSSKPVLMIVAPEEGLGATGLQGQGIPPSLQTGVIMVLMYPYL